jgi:hypothetical protein
MIGRMAFQGRDRAHQRRVAAMCAVCMTGDLLGLLRNDGALRLTCP